MAKQLNSEQRYIIYLDLQSKLTKKSIAQKIGVHPSTITREVKRNANRDKEKRNNTVLPKRPISRTEQAFMSVLRKPMANALETGRWI